MTSERKRITDKIAGRIEFFGSPLIFLVCLLASLTTEDAIASAIWGASAVYLYVNAEAAE